METVGKPMYKPLQCRRCMSPLGRYIDETFELDLEAVITTVLGKYHECAPSFEHLCVPYEKPAPPSAPDTAEPASKKRKPSTPANAEVKMTLAERVKMLEEVRMNGEQCKSRRSVATTINLENSFRLASLVHMARH